MLTTRREDMKTELATYHALKKQGIIKEYGKHGGDTDPTSPWVVCAKGIDAGSYEIWHFNGRDYFALDCVVYGRLGDIVRQRYTYYLYLRGS
jgi:hypothetical protein